MKTKKKTMTQAFLIGLLAPLSVAHYITQMNLLVGASPSVTHDAGQVSGRILEARLPVTLRWALLFLFLVSLFSLLSLVLPFSLVQFGSALCAVSPCYGKICHALFAVYCCYILCNFDDMF